MMHKRINFFRWLGGGPGWWLGNVKFSYTKNLEREYFYKESRSNKKKKSLVVGRGEYGGRLG